jgi:hypothetical protein
VQHVIFDRARLASCIALAYVAVVLGGVLLRYVMTGDGYTARYSLMLPSTWIAIAVAALVAWGLWRRFRWAWWVGLAAVLTQFVLMTSWMIDHFTFTKLPGWGVFVVFALLVAFLVVLLLPGTRSACSR